MFGLAAIIVGISDPSVPAPPLCVLFNEPAGRHSHEGCHPGLGAQACVLAFSCVDKESFKQVVGTQYQTDSSA